MENLAENIVEKTVLTQICCFTEIFQNIPVKKICKNNSSGEKNLVRECRVKLLLLFKFDIYAIYHQRSCKSSVCLYQHFFSKYNVSI